MKKQNIIFPVIIFFLCFCTSLHARVSESLDSLQALLKKEKRDSQKVDLLNKISWELQFSDPDSALIIAKKTLALTLKISYSIGTFNTYGNIASIYEEKAEYETSLVYYDSMLLFSGNIGKKSKEIARFYSRRGNVLHTLGQYPKALNEFLTCLKISEEINDSSLIADAYSNIGIIYRLLKKYNEALRYSLNSLKIREKSGDVSSILSSLIGMGLLYTEKQMLDSALFYYKKTLPMLVNFNDKTVKAIVNNNIANVYFYKEEYDQALTYYLISLEIAEDLDNIFGISLLKTNIGAIYVKLKKYDKAIQYLKEGSDLAKEIKSNDLLKDGLKNLSETYSELGDYKTALNYFQQYSLLKDTIYSETGIAQIAEMEARYENIKKQKEIELLNKDKEVQKSEIKRQTLQKYAIIAGLALVLVFFIILFKSYRDKRKANILLASQKMEISEKNEELHQQNEEIAAQRDSLDRLNQDLEQKNSEITSQRDEISAQRDLVTRQKEQIEVIHKDLTDSIHYALRIQTAVLPDLSKGASESPSLWGGLGGVFILFKPRDIVSGDFYWVARRKNTLFLAVADCTGHGVPGAFMSMLGVSFLNEIVAREDISTAGGILDLLRNYLIKSLQQSGDTADASRALRHAQCDTSVLGGMKDGMDIALVAINTIACTDAINRVSTYNLQYAGANNPLYIVKKVSPLEEVKPLNEIKGDKQPVAIYELMTPFTNHELQVSSGDILYLFSDGYQDQFGGPKGKKFKSKKLKQLLSDNCNKPLSVQKEIIDKTLEDWKGAFNNKYEQTDDITVLGIRI